MLSPTAALGTTLYAFPTNELAVELLRQILGFDNKFDWLELVIKSVGSRADGEEVNARDTWLVEVLVEELLVGKIEL